MTPSEKRAELYGKADSATKMADRFIAGSNGGRETGSVRQAKNNLRLALAAVEHIEGINAGIPEPKVG